MHAGKDVAVKVLRPGMLPVIDSDLALLRDIANWAERLWADGKRLKPREVVAEFDKYLHDELDLMREAANGSQLRRNFAGLDLLLVPEMYWDFSAPTVLVMERMVGVPISQVETLRAAGVDIPKLAREGVEIFFTQVFRDGFFHADMHPGNIQVSLDPAQFGRYIALDFGIVGALSDFDKNYLAQNFLAFFKRDYHRVATLHLESGWVPPNTRVEELESAIRAVCEPYFDRALKDISLGQVLMRLFSTSRRFNVEIQPQLVLLQKTMLNVEGLGRSLDPELDLWKTAKPYLERWMNEQIGWRGWYERLQMEAPQWSKTLPQMPRLIHQLLAERHDLPRRGNDELMRMILVEQKKHESSAAGVADIRAGGGRGRRDRAVLADVSRTGVEGSMSDPSNPLCRPSKRAIRIRPISGTSASISVHALGSGGRAGSVSGVRRRHCTPRNVLIPGCGSAYEALWLAQAGWPVKAIDFSPSAVAAAREQLGEHADVVEQADFFAYSRRSRTTGSTSARFSARCRRTAGRTTPRAWPRCCGRARCSPASFSSARRRKGRRSASNATRSTPC